MRLLIDLSSPSDLPSLEKVKEVFRYAEEMGLNAYKFDHVRVHFINERKVSFEASYKQIYADDTPGTLMIVIEVRKGKPFGRFWIWDPAQKSNIAYSETLPYKEILPLLEKAQDIGTLHRDIRAQWHQQKGWKDLLPFVKHSEQ